MKKLLLFSAAIAVLIIGCGPRYPVTTVNTVDSRPTLSFKNTPVESMVLVDGINMGKASEFNGRPKVLTVQPGTHEVTILDHNNNPIYQETVFVQSEHRVISVK